ncbi:Protein broad-minded [Exaiptasia diaphana]|nr:Protein broad-minded [Exaiptasia diaphana]
MMDQCIGYMYKRYTKKLQVSKCEKFGYGVMVCQFAATAPGIVALEKKGYLQRLIQDVWLVFEGLYDRRLQPIIKHIDTIDSRAYSKALNNLLSVFSAFPAVYEVLTVHNRPSTSTSEVEEIKPVEHELDAPVTFAELINRLIFIDSDSKISSLFNYEQSHHFGLRVLNVLCSCLDTLLFLESTYHFTELLLQAQLDNRLENGKDYIIDRCSIERNQILVKSYWVGGPSERILPGRDLTEDKSKPYPWPLFSSFPPPKDYVVQDYAVITNAFEEGDSILEFLEGEKPSKDESIEWLEKFRELFCKTIKSGGFKCKTKVLKLLLESVCHVLTNIPEESIFPLIEFSVGELSLKNTDLSSIESLGVKLVIRYGLQLKILQSKGDSTEDLQHLLKYAKFFMRSQQKVPDSTLRILTLCLDDIGNGIDGENDDSNEEDAYR